MNKPVLILAHERPELLQKCLARLKLAGCTNLYASVDGPSPSKNKEYGEVVSMLSAAVDSEKLNLISTNLGCEKGVLNGIDWLFNHEEKVIIIEEDVLISKTGLLFLSEMLDKYENEPLVFMAGAHLPTGSWNKNQNHFFSRIGHIWGWATWKNRWQKHDPSKTESLINSNLIQDSFGYTKIAKHLESNLNKCFSGEIDTWDFQWNMTMLANNGKCILPNSNQVENIGIAAHSLHTTALHAGVCNSFQTPILTSQDSIPAIADREYEHEWFRRLKGETAQLNIKSVRQELSNQVRFKGSVCLVNLTEIGGGAEKICHSIFTSAKPAEKEFLVSVKKTDNPKVIEFATPSRIERWLKPISELKRHTKSADVIHLHNIHGMDLRWDDLAVIADSKPIIWTLHDQWILGKNLKPPFVEEDSIPKKKLKFINHKNVQLVAPSLWLQDKVYWKTGKLPTLIRYGIDTNIYRPIERSIACKNLGLNPNKKRVLFIANNPQFNPYKDFPTLQEGWLKANTDLPEAGFDLVALGGQQMSKPFGKHNMIVIPFTDNENHVCSWINACDMVVHATLSDNSPVSILEAMACKTPVIATNIGGINEQLNNGNCGILVRPRSITDLAESILTLHHRSEANQDTVAAAYSRVMTNYTKKSMIDAYLGLYAKVCR